MNEPSSERGTHEQIAGEARTLVHLVGIPIAIAIAIVLAIVALGLIGGWSLLRYSLALLFTWNGAFRALCVIGGLAGVTWVRHATTYRHAPPPVWFRRSVKTNIIEVLVFAAVILTGIWALHQFLPAPLP